MEEASLNQQRWKIGDRIEAKDFMNVWYQSKVVAYDEKEDAILVHFEGWNQRFDEWFPSNSDKIRPLTKESISHRETSKISSTKFLKVGQYVLAPWKDGKIYPGKIKNINHRQKKYEVAFLDGIDSKVSFRKVHVMTDEEISELNCNVGESSETCSFMTDTNSTFEGDIVSHNVCELRGKAGCRREESLDEPPTKKPRLLSTSTCSVESFPLHEIENKVELMRPFGKEDPRQGDECPHHCCQAYRKTAGPSSQSKCFVSPSYEQFSPPKSHNLINSLYCIKKMLRNSEKNVKNVKKLAEGNISGEKVFSDCEHIKADQRTIEKFLNKIEELVDGGVL